MDVLKKKGKIHLIGIGGIGMSAIARILLGRGCRVTGSDENDSPLIEKLRNSGAAINVGHRAVNVGDADLVVYSSAVSEDNPEMLAARDKKIPRMSRGQMLAELLEGYRSVVVSGSHGKTTTTALIAVIFSRAGLDPSFAVGGEVPALDGNARMGGGKHFIVESDESDGSFLLLKPFYSVVTNVDREHLDYYPDLKAIIQAYRRFVGQTDPKGCLFTSADCSHLREISREYRGEQVRFGLKGKGDIYPELLVSGRSGFEFDCIFFGRNLGRVKVPVPGRHNVANALAAIAVGLKAGVDFPVMQKALAEDWKVRRRFDVRFRRNGITVIEDYGHHPTEITAVLEAARQWHPGRLVVVFQPHRFTRTKFLMDEFAVSLAAADYLVLTDIYPASEKPIPGVSIRGIYDRMKSAGRENIFCLARAEIAGYLRGELRAGDLVLVLGAGNINRLVEELEKELT